MNLARSLVQTLCLAGALISPTAFADSACNKQPVPAASVQAVGRDMIVSGVPTSVLAVDFNGTPEDVTNQFRDFWTREDVPFKGQRGPSGLLLSALDGNCHYVLTSRRSPTADTPKDCSASCDSAPAPCSTRCRTQRYRCRKAAGSFRISKVAIQARPAGHGFSKCPAAPA